MANGPRDIHRRRMRRHRFPDGIRRELAALSKIRDDWHGPLAFGTDLLVIALAILGATLHPLLYPVTLVVIGTRQRALATVLHETTHYSFCRARPLNRALGMAAGWPILQTFHAYRASHVEEHHPHLGDERRDPDLANYRRQGLFETDARGLLRDHFVPLLLGLKAWTNFKNTVRDRLLPRRWDDLPAAARREYLGIALFWTVGLALLFAFDLMWAFFLFWVVPYFTVFQATNWVIEVAEHFPLVRLYDGELHMTRNRRGPWIERALTGIHGENWHLVHHLVPGIPFWKLAEAHEVMMRDPVYRAANDRSGGLFFRGPAGEPSILSLLGEQLGTARPAGAARATAHARAAE